jgi:hypothetical protein
LIREPVAQRTIAHMKKGQAYRLPFSLRNNVPLAYSGFFS